MVNYLPLILTALVIVPILANRWLYKEQKRLGTGSKESARLENLIDFFDALAVALLLSVWVAAYLSK